MTIKKKYQEFTDISTEYVLEVTVAGYPADNVKQRGTLTELAKDWEIVDSLITRRDGSRDDSMIFEPITMKLTIGLATYKLHPVEE